MILIANQWYSFHLYFYVSIYLSIHPIHLSIYPSPLYHVLSLSLSLCTYMYLSIYLSGSLFLSIYLPLSLYSCTTLCKSLYLSIYLYVSLSPFISVIHLAIFLCHLWFFSLSLCINSVCTSLSLYTFYPSISLSLCMYLRLCFSSVYGPFSVYMKRLYYSWNNFNTVHGFLIVNSKCF